MPKLRKKHKELLASCEDIQKQLKAEDLDKDDRKNLIISLSDTADELDQITASIKEEEAEEKLLSRVGSYKDLEPALSLPSRDVEVTHVKDLVFEDPKLGFESLGDCALAAHGAATGQIYDKRLDVLNAIDGLNQKKPSKGGFLVPPQFRNRIWEEAQVMSTNLWNRTDNFTFEGESLSMPAIDQKSRKTGQRWGGTQAFWLDEGSEMTLSDPTFREVEIRPKQLAVFTKVTNKLLRNSPFALDQFLNRASTDEIVFTLSDAVINGDGVGKPKGILNSGALVVINAESGQTADTVVPQNVNKMYNRLPTKWLPGAAWYVHRTVIPQLESMVVGDMPVYLPPGGLADRPLGTLKGLPVFSIEYMNPVGDEGDILLTNLRAYFSGQNGTMQNDMSIHFYYDTNRTAFRWILDADGQTYQQEAVEEFKGTDLVSPYITLAERA